MNGFIDQIDNGIALIIIENQSIHVPLSALPAGVSEGCYVTISFQLNKVEEMHVKKDVENLIGAMAENEGDDFEL